MILYFSGTGNSKYFAKELGKLLDDECISLNDKLKNNDKKDINVNKKLIIVSPTYAWRMPRIVTKYILENNFKNVEQIYFIQTCGGQIGNSEKYNKEICEIKKWNYKGTASLILPDNYYIMFNEISDQRANSLLRHADKRIQEISKKILRNENLDEEKVSLYGKFLSRFINPKFYQKYVSKKGWNIDKSKCICCGICVKVCPLNNISMKNNNYPNFDNHCTQCMACFSYCPKRAIDYKDKTKGKKPYKIENYRKIK